MIAIPLCARRGCAHYIGMRAKTDGEFGATFLSPHVPCCAAFPAGIPDEIRSGKNDHTTPFAGDNGITFKESKGVYFPPGALLGVASSLAKHEQRGVATISDNKIGNPYHDETGKFTSADDAGDSVKKK